MKDKIIPIEGPLTEKEKSFRSENSEVIRALASKLGIGREKSPKKETAYNLKILSEDYELYKTLATELDMTFKKYANEALRHYTLQRLKQIDKVRNPKPKSSKEGKDETIKEDTSEGNGQAKSDSQ